KLLSRHMSHVPRRQRVLVTHVSSPSRYGLSPGVSHCSGGQSGSMTPHSAAAHSAPSCHAPALMDASHRPKSEWDNVGRRSTRMSRGKHAASSTTPVVGVYWSLIGLFLPVGFLSSGGVGEEAIADSNFRYALSRSLRRSISSKSSRSSASSKTQPIASSNSF